MADVGAHQLKGCMFMVIVIISKIYLICRGHLVRMNVEARMTMFTFNSINSGRRVYYT
jgi:hypothetical protein